MNKLLATLLVIASLGFADASARCRRPCAAPCIRTCEVPRCYVEKVITEEVPAECEQVCWCPPGTIQAQGTLGAPRLIK